MNTHDINTQTTTVVIVSGLSGAGKTVALHALEDCGYYCVDHLPADVLMPTLLSLKKKNVRHIAIGLDPWDKGFLNNVSQHWCSAEEQGFTIKLLLLTARQDVLQRRYSETRRSHPLAINNRSVADAIAVETRILRRVPPGAFSIDTSDMSAAVLKDRVKDFLGLKNDQMTIVLETFGFKHNSPINADLVFDVRCLPNPHYDPVLRTQSGLDAEVIAYFEQHASVELMIDTISSFIQNWKSEYEKDHRSYLTVGIGCTGGQHRSVYVAESVKKKLLNRDISSLVRHREVTRWKKAPST